MTAPAFTERPMTLDGVALTEEEVATIRVALTAFAAQLNRPAGADLHGRGAAAAYARVAGGLLARLTGR